jgi:hypothetical protein
VNDFYKQNLKQVSRTNFTDVRTRCLILAERYLVEVDLRCFQKSKLDALMRPYLQLAKDKFESELKSDLVNQNPATKVSPEEQETYFNSLLLKARYYLAFKNPLKASKHAAKAYSFVLSSVTQKLPLLKMKQAARYVMVQIAI